MLQSREHTVVFFAGFINYPLKSKASANPTKEITCRQVWEKTHTKKDGTISDSASSYFANTREVPQLGSHTVQSHGIKLAKTHLHDWIILILLCVLVVVLGIMSPFYRFVGKDMMDDLKYPHKSSTIPIWAVSIIAALLPVVIFVAFYIRRRNVYDLHHAVLGILFSLLITGVLTNAIKLAVGRPRPDFFWRCFPDGKQQYDNVTGQVICHGEKSIMNAGHKSFPSGHTSWSFAGLSFLSLYLAGKIKAFDHKGHVAKLCIVFLPLLIASLIGISRVDDYRHHWEDVFAGGILGSIIALICYLQFFPPPYNTNGWGPHAYFESLEIIRNSERQQAEERNNNAASSSTIHSACNLDGANKAASPGTITHNDIEAGMVQRE